MLVPVEFDLQEKQAGVQCLSSVFPSALWCIFCKLWDVSINFNLSMSTIDMENLISYHTEVPLYNPPLPPRSLFGQMLVLFSERHTLCNTLCSPCNTLCSQQSCTNGIKHLEMASHAYLLTFSAKPDITASCCTCLGDVMQWYAYQLHNAMSYRFIGQCRLKYI